MEFIIIPTKVFQQADMNLAKKLGLSNPRKSTDETEVIMHVENYVRLFGSPKARNRTDYPIYDSKDGRFAKLMESEVWISKEELY